MKSDTIIRTGHSLSEKGVRSGGLRLYGHGSTAVVFRSGVLRHTFPVAWGEVLFTVNQDMKVLTPGPDIAARYAYHVLRGIGRQVVNVAVKSGTTVESVDFNIFKKLPVHVPPLPEQRRIAEILDTIDQAIRKTEQVIAKLQQMKQGLLHDLLTRGIDEHGELRPPPSEAPELYKGSPLGWIPRNWEVAPFEHYSWPGRPFLRTGPFGSSLKGEHWVETGTPVITIGALGEGKFIESELLFVSDQKAGELAAYAVQTGDIVFSRVADVGRSVVVTEGEAGWIMSSNLMWISLDPAHVHPAFVWLSLSANPMVRRQVRRFVNAGGREVANGSILRSLQLAWPNSSEQGISDRLGRNCA